MKIKLFIALILVSQSLIAQTTIEHLTINSEHLDETRTLKIALPSEYENSIKNYPIILILDDGLLFNPTTAIVNQLSNTSRMPESIVVSLSPGEKHRNHFAPDLYNNHRNKMYNYGNHQEEFVNFLELELLPLLEEKYRTNHFKTFIGFSPSSAIGLYTLMNKPNLFQAYICFAAANIIGDGFDKGERLIERLETLYSQENIEQSYLYVVSGSKDADSQPYINANVQDFNEKLSKLNGSNIQTRANLIQGEGHTDVILPGLLSAFDFLFPKEKWLIDYLDLIENEGAAKDNISSFYQKLSAEYKFEIYPNADRLYSMSCLKNIGRRLLGANKIDQALEIYQYWVELYPSSHLAHYNLGLAYEQNKDNGMASTAYKRAYDLALVQKSEDSKTYKVAINNLNK